MTEGEDRRCIDCWFWAKKITWYGIYGLHGHHTDGSVSDCRRYSPRNVRDETERYDTNAVWPRTGRDDWCGEFARDHREAPKPASASGIAARSDETQSGSAEGKSPVPEADAHTSANTAEHRGN